MFVQNEENAAENPIRKLYIEPSSRCNFNCSMCFRNNWIDEKQGFMQEEAFESILRSAEAAPPELVVFGGMGEPLLHPRTPDWIAALHKLGCRVEIITNASLLSEEMCLRLKEAGLDCIWISMEAFSKESYEQVRKGAEYDRLVGHMATWNRVRGESQHPELGITFVMLRENMRELAQINRFADEHRVDHINLSHAIPNAPISKEEVIYWDGYPVGSMHRWQPGFVPRRENYCRFVSENNVFVRWDGDVAPCMQLLHETHTYLYEEQRRIHRISFGNVLQQDLNEIWHSPDYSDFRKRVRAFDFPDCTLCNGCDWRLSNEEDCDYNPFPTCGACLWGQGIAFCP